MTDDRLAVFGERLEPAELDWRQDAAQQEAPFSTRYDDVYFSRDNGRAETQFVFLDNNDLPRRFRTWDTARPFVIGETGCGTGLNLLCAWACFEQHAPAAARLHLISTEKHPLSREALQRVWQSWPDFATRAQALIAQWPQPVPGVHRLRLSPRVTLDLHFGDAAACLARLDGQVDAWFLDGFAPAKNPDMWQPALFAALASASRPGATFATFTCAGLVRRGLAAEGFRWRKVPGFGRKREMLRGEWQPDGLTTPHASQCPTRRSAPRAATPWFIPPPPRPAQHVAVIGAGIAGTSVAEALARRGSRVSLIDRGGIASGASGNPQAALYVKLAAETNRQSRFYLAALLYVQRWLAALDPERSLWRDSGLLQLAIGEREQRRQQRFLDNYVLPETLVSGCDAARASELAGTPLAHSALAYPLAGWVDPAALCQRLAATPGVEYRRATLDSLEAIDAGWQLALSDGQLQVDQVVFASGHASGAWLDGLPLQQVRGQIASLPWTAPDAPAQVLCGEGYVLPPYAGRLTFGATFTPKDGDTRLREADQQRNLDELSRTAPALHATLCADGEAAALAALDGRASVRAASPDKTPYAGPLPDSAGWRQEYAALAKDARQRFTTPGRHHPGLWVSTAHGSRGLVSAPLCAELIASRLHDEPLPLERELVDHLHPGRRLIAELIRQA
ncbi:bifunctional tRNA (5-methylaminomethyl-2-thiouridine)(34)-methyltransferase MnmD/FAD-dependent 5-carboxymethylaminomethyl-2-thiouridine(34) oxidoreductase MnmC [Salinicola endophyticus]|uniref:bifunctional tRNA (5-methylaminomethyl-2-thiouridine)(34)-methyltransferase MnmD/FAD-dependent 5-carboxymethylaminomethyl-2-thiouridine(34) oxidoreductase MnmC n=1 Tax=Salinicola endophyticus TaxID=1949083 RepID=UPI000DA24A9E|nr:bifunctional tRNA (5-methylaminomethyl-2-thiouridine)(34)-methyltransferase MnmD/FAD-dependent 5-carboxymethylaminomethyl-2-thiouridine(34) oxidoreductase MnmC [Salinicola endophyticus]